MFLCFPDDFPMNLQCQITHGAWLVTWSQPWATAGSPGVQLSAMRGVIGLSGCLDLSCMTEGCVGHLGTLVPDGQATNLSENLISEHVARS